MSLPSSSASMAPLCLSLPFRTLRGAFRLAVALVLEHSYNHRGGYKLSPAEKRRFEVVQQKFKLSSLETRKAQSSQQQQPSPSSNPHDTKNQFENLNLNQMDVAFTERRMRILQMLGGGKNSRSLSSSSSRHGSEYTSDSGSSLGSTKGSIAYNSERSQDCTGPPFTIQRVAEVLLMPERVSLFFMIYGIIITIILI